MNMINDNIFQYSIRTDNESINEHFIQPNYVKHNNKDKVKNNKCNQSSSLTTTILSLNKNKITKQPRQIIELVRIYKLVETNIKTTSKFHQVSGTISKQF